VSVTGREAAESRLDVSVSLDDMCQLRGAGFVIVTIDVLDYLAFMLWGHDFSGVGGELKGWVALQSFKYYLDLKNIYLFQLFFCSWFFDFTTRLKGGPIEQDPECGSN
jgi:hypothetical protein